MICYAKLADYPITLTDDTCSHMMMHKCLRGTGSLLHVGKGATLQVPRFSPRVLEDILQSQFCSRPPTPTVLGVTKPWSKNIHLNPPVTHRGLSGESLVPSFGDKSKKRGKPAKRIKVAEQGRVYGNLRLVTRL